ncbi:ferritin-like domain-containing protein [uncultured Clostridium sp.]|uniref:ferritin-like domain-containing protein n=1 Tax=uncultured Clostridium sp. TaxID=59620 RepID=UPI003217F3D1
MSYSTDRQPQGIAKSVEGFLREGLVAELVAINDYSHFIAITDNKELKELFHHIMEDEKRHYAMYLNALRCVDPEQAELEEEAREHVNISSKEKYKDYTNKYDKDVNLLVTIREGIKGELEAILLYEQFVRNLNNSTLAKIINEITRDEKEHVEELTRALVILDKDNYGTL